MSWIDLTRIITLAGYLTAAGVAIRQVCATQLRQRRRSLILIAVVAVSWVLFYSWITPAAWGGSPVSSSTRELWASASRIAHAVTIVGLLVMLRAIDIAERAEARAVELAAEQLNQARAAIGATIDD